MATFRRFFLMLFGIAIIVILLSSCASVKKLQSAFVATTDFFRVEQFPTNEEIPIAGGSAFAGKPIEHTYQAPAEKVWAALRRTALRLEALSKKKVEGVTLSHRPVIRLDENAGRIEVGKIEDPGEMGRFRGIGVTAYGNSWGDGFTITIKALSPTQTNVTVSRRVVTAEPEKIDQFGTSFRDKLLERASTGNYERWILTQIEDDLAGKLKRESLAIVQLKPTEPPGATFSYRPSRRSTSTGRMLSLLKLQLTINGLDPVHLSFPAENLFRKLTSESFVYIFQLLKAYKDSTESALQRAILAQGYRITGTLEHLDDMTYPQKQAAPLVLMPQAVLSLREMYDQNSVIEGQITKGTSQDSLCPGVVKGKLSMAGHLELYLYEPFSREKMWAKKVSISRQQRDFTYKWTMPGAEYFGGELDPKDFVHGEDTRPKVLSEMLMGEYLKVLEEVFNSLNPSELQPIFESANELRTKRK